VDSRTRETGNDRSKQEKRRKKGQLRVNLSHPGLGGGFLAVSWRGKEKKLPQQANFFVSGDWQ
jgi:hypothetical protein